MGFVKAIVDAPCPTEVGDNNWRDYYNVPFDPPGIIVRACPENNGAQAIQSLFMFNKLIFAGRRIETINSKSGLKNYKEIFDTNSFSQISTSVASSLTSCALDCRSSLCFRSSKVKLVFIIQES